MDNNECEWCDGTGVICYECGCPKEECLCDDPDFGECEECGGSGEAD